MIRISGPAILSERENQETLVINLDSGCYYCLRGLSSLAWQEILSETSVSQLLETLGAQEGDYSAEELEAAISNFLNTLAEDGIITLGGEEITQKATGQSAALLEIQKYEDLKSLLLVDPIHEVRLSEVVSEENTPDDKSKDSSG